MEKITLPTFNTLPEAEATDVLEQCCVSRTWSAKMMKNRPFSSESELITTAASLWYNECTPEDYKEAFTGHPKIGDVDSLREKFTRTKDWAGEEQQKVAEAGEATLRELAEANTHYEKKFGYIFIVSASGKTAGEMLTILNARLQHREADELQVAINEQHKITVIRLARLITGLAEKADLGSHLTTHALDTSAGVPARGMLVTLQTLREEERRPVSVGITNKDGRVPDVLAPGKKLAPGTYIMRFNTGAYYEAAGQQGFYPEVSVQFKITDESHYHIPLLISPYGYTTYRGS